MPEGWHGDNYLVIFERAQAESLAARYAIARFLPDHRLVGLRGWDDFIVADASNRTFTVPTVPLVAEHPAPFEVPPVESLQPDPRFTGKVKWYIKPLVFGGDAVAKDNLTWISLDQHAQVVVWFNDLYRKLVSN